MLLNSITVDDFKKMINDIVEEKISLFARKFMKSSRSDILTRKETAVLLQVDLSTLHEWRIKNILIPEKIGGRVYYRKADIDKLLTR